MRMSKMYFDLFENYYFFTMDIFMSQYYTKLMDRKKIVTPAEVEEQRRQREEQAAKEARSKELAKARYEKRKA